MNPKRGFASKNPPAQKRKELPIKLVDATGAAGTTKSVTDVAESPVLGPRQHPPATIARTLGREIPERIKYVVGANLAHFRHSKGWTQAKAAKQLGMSVRNLQRHEAGWNMTITTAAKLARAYGWPTWQLFVVPRGKPLRRGPGRPRKQLPATV